MATVVGAAVGQPVAQPVHHFASRLELIEGRLGTGNWQPAPPLERDDELRRRDGGVVRAIRHELQPGASARLGHRDEPCGLAVLARDVRCHPVLLLACLQRRLPEAYVHNRAERALAWRFGFALGVKHVGRGRQRAGKARREVAVVHLARQVVVLVLRALLSEVLEARVLRREQRVLVA